MKFRKKPLVIEATQWFKNGDHPEDNCKVVGPRHRATQTEGAVVRRFRRPDIPGGQQCKQCRYPVHDHGWIDTLEGGHIVCPSDWIITGVTGELYPIKDEIFRETYERVSDEAERAKLLKPQSVVQE